MKKGLLLVLTIIAAYTINAQVSEDFSTTVNNENIALPGWTNFAETGTRVFIGKYYATETNYYAQMSSYNSGEASEVVWFVSPKVVADGSSTLNFRSKSGYTNADVSSLWISTNFEGDVNAAGWTPLTFAEPTDNGSTYSAWVASGNIDLSSYSGQSINIAFKYTGGDPGATTTWQIDDVIITGTGTGINNINKNISVYPNPTKSILNFSNQSIIKNILVSNVIGQKIMSLNNINSKNISLNVSELINGVYLLNINNIDGSSSISKFIKE